MKRTILHLLPIALAGCAVWLVLSLINPARAQSPQAQPESIPGVEVVLRAGTDYRPYHVPAPIAPDMAMRAPLASNAVTFQINWNPASCTGTVAAWSTAARTAFQYAVDIWSSILTGTRTIVIDACWRTDMAANVLGSAGPNNYYKDFTGAPATNTWYAVALANQLSNSDLNGSPAEIHANFNSEFTWYYGLDGNAGAAQYDFVTVVLHEVGHGVGFLGSMNWDDGASSVECNDVFGTGCWGGGTSWPFTFDRFVENGAGQRLVTVFANNTITLGNQLIGDNLFFDGANANAANGGARPKLYAPAGWDPGSSYSHLNEDTFNNSFDALMTPMIDLAESIHYPGAIALGMLKDTGWPVPNLATVYVDNGNTGFEDGSSLHPFDTITEGVTAVHNSGTVWIETGSYQGTPTLDRPMTLNSLNGTATIGQ